MRGEARISEANWGVGGKRKGLINGAFFGARTVLSATSIPLGPGASVLRPKALTGKCLVENPQVV